MELSHLPKGGVRVGGRGREGREGRERESRVGGGWREWRGEKERERESGSSSSFFPRPKYPIFSGRFRSLTFSRLTDHPIDHLISHH